MSDARPSRSARFPGVRLGDVPVLAALAAAAVAGYVALDAGDRAPAPVETAALPPAPPAPPVAEPITAAAPPPAGASSSAAAPMEEPAPAPPLPVTVADPLPEPAPEPVTAPPSPHVTADSLLGDLRTALAGVRCAELRADPADGVLSVTGTVTSLEDQDRVQRIVEALPPGLTRPPAVAVASAALCEPLLLLEPLRGANAARGMPLTVAAIPGEGVLTGGQDLVLDLRSLEGAGAVQVDYFTVDGGVVHLLPNPTEPAAKLEPGAVRRLGERSGRTRFWTIGPPFGHELIVVIASASPLFPAPRPEAEPATNYLPELKRALAGPGTEGALAAALFITTRAP